MWVRQCHRPAMTGNGKYVPPIRMVMTGGWFIMRSPCFIKMIWNINHECLSKIL